MAQFQFHQDAKQTVWQRSFFTIEADSREVAIERLRILKDVDLTEVAGNEFGGEVEPEYAGIRFEHCETLFDAASIITPEKNGGQSTLELFDDQGMPIADNGIADNLDSEESRQRWQ